MRAGGDGQQGDEGDSFVNWNPDDDQALRDHIEQTTSSVARLASRSLSCRTWTRLGC